MRLVSAIQFNPKFAREKGQILENIRSCRPLWERAASLGSDLIVFPELAFCGYSYFSRNEVFNVAERRDGATFRVMQSIAIDIESYMVYGFPELDGDILYNSANLISPQGDLLHTYRKINLWGNDYFWATPSRSPNPVFTSTIGNISVLICRDMRNLTQEDKQILAHKQADIICCVAQWKMEGIPPVTWMDLQKETGACLVVANRWGFEDNAGFSAGFGPGGSMIIDKNGTPRLDGMKFNSDSVVTIQI